MLLFSCRSAQSTFLYQRCWNIRAKIGGRLYICPRPIYPPSRRCVSVVFFHEVCCYYAKRNLYSGRRAVHFGNFSGVPWLVPQLKETKPYSGYWKLHLETTDGQSWDSVSPIIWQFHLDRLHICVYLENIYCIRFLYYFSNVTQF